MKRREAGHSHKRLWLLCTVITVVLFCAAAISLAGNDKSYLSSVGTAYFQDKRTQTMWTAVKSKKLDTVAEVRQYLTRLNEREYNDWRLPTKQELYDLFTVFDLKNNGKVRISIEGNYWMRKPEGKIIAGAWEIGDGCGPERVYYSKEKGYVRAVRP
ncbi:DUF1566 domain-containing protein [Desulfogranum marinum]|uniref:Lcl domain-containing protein n=1 Tax=Desulfogranum marinum TaxID=453220 RepID=UPI0029C7F23E|nr:DUF1566 domain-containing protein [Desulfogranum marinum]